MTFGASAFSVAILSLTAYTAQGAALDPSGTPVGFIRAAEQINRNLPKMIEPNIRMDRAEAGPGYSMSMYYTITNKHSLAVNSSMLREAAYPPLRDALCNDPLQKMALAEGAIYSYVYTGNDGGVILRLSVDRSAC